MADPTLRLTYDDMRLRVAEYLGIADYTSGAAAIPTDAHDLDKVSRLVNDGYRRFLRSAAWKFLAVPLTISTTAGVQTVSLPDDFGGSLLDPFTGTTIEVRQVPEEMIRELETSGPSSGQPALYALRAINTTAATTATRWQVMFWPIPGAVYALTARYRRWPAALSAGTDRSVAGFQHDEAVVNAALAAAELDVNDVIGTREQAFQRSLMDSKAVDRATAPARILDYGDRSDEGRGFKRGSVTQYNGVTLDY